MHTLKSDKGVKKMAKLWDKIKDVVQEKAYLVAEKTEEFTKIGRAKLEIAKVKRDITRELAELGGEAYNLINEGKGKEIAGSDKVKRLVEKVKLLELDLEDKTKKLEDLRKEKESKGEGPEEEEPKGEGEPQQ